MLWPFSYGRVRFRTSPISNGTSFRTTFLSGVRQLERRERRVPRRMRPKATGIVDLWYALFSPSAGEARLFEDLWIRKHVPPHRILVPLVILECRITNAPTLF